MGIFSRFFKRFIWSLRSSILSIYITLFVIAMLIVIGVSHYRFSEVMSYVSLSLMADVSGSLSNDVVIEVQDVIAETEFMASLLKAGVLKNGDQQKIMEYTAAIFATRR